MMCPKCGNRLLWTDGAFCNQCMMSTGSTRRCSSIGSSYVKQALDSRDPTAAEPGTEMGNKERAEQFIDDCGDMSDVVEQLSELGAQQFSHLPRYVKTMLDLCDEVRVSDRKTARAILDKITAWLDNPEIML